MLIEKMSSREEASNLPYLNTGTFVDISNGRFIPGYDGKWYLDGGLSIFTAISGKPQTYKSTVAGALLARSMNIYPDSDAFILETENTISSKTRYDEFVDKKVSDRIMFHNNTTMNLSEFYALLNEAATLKKKEKKNFMVESPFVDIKTGKRKLMWIPTFAMIDSFSKAIGNKSEDLAIEQKVTIDDSSLQTLYMQEGLLKSRFLSFLAILASQCGIYCIFTSHIGEKKDLNSYTPTPKQLQFMSQKDRLRNVGSEFEYLMTTLLQTKSATMLTNKDKDKCKYGYKDLSPANEVSEIEVVSVRGKSLGSGYRLKYVCSQYEGVLADVTNYHYLRNLPKAATVLEQQGRGYKFPGELLPDVTLSDGTIREITKNSYEVRRGLELLTQLTFIHQNWPLFKLPEFISIPILTFAEKIAKGGTLVSDILNTTGNWSYAKQDRPYLSVMDVAEMLTKEIKQTKTK